MYPWSNRPCFLILSADNRSVHRGFRGPVSHFAIGTPKPFFLRLMIDDGNFPFINFLRRYLVVPFRYLKEYGSAKTKSTFVWSRNGARTSSAYRMLARSTFTKTWSIRYVRAYVHNMRLPKSFGLYSAAYDCASANTSPFIEILARARRAVSLKVPSHSMCLRAASGESLETNFLRLWENAKFAWDTGSISAAFDTARRKTLGNLRYKSKSLSARNVGYPANNSSPPSPPSATVTCSRANFESSRVGIMDASASGSSRTSARRGTIANASFEVTVRSWCTVPKCPATNRAWLDSSNDLSSKAMEKVSIGRLLSLCA